MKQRTITALCALALLLGAGQFGLWAQGPEKAVPIGTGVNTEYDETQPRLSPDDSTLYFVRYQYPGNIGGRAGGQDIWFSRRRPDGSWGQAQNIGSVLNDGRHNAVGASVIGGNVLYLSNCYAQEVTGDIPQGHAPGISSTRRAGDKWTRPDPVQFLDGADTLLRGTFGFHIPADMSVMVLSMMPLDSGKGLKEDLYVSFAESASSWTTPRSLGDIVNTYGRETAPFLAPDGETLYFTSDGHDGLGKGDIFVSRRLDDTWTNWSEPVNLGPAVNTKGYDAHFITDQSGKEAFFMSGPDHGALGDIYSIQLSEIPALQDSSLPDTLFVFTKMGEPVAFDLTDLGIAAQDANLAAGRSLDGNGKVRIRDGSEPFLYEPAEGFAGRESLLIDFCDPPQSDNCHEVVVVAEVEGPTIVMGSFTLRDKTNQNVPLHFDLLSVGADAVNLWPDGPTVRGGKLRRVQEPAMDYLVYTPPTDFIGVDTAYIYRRGADASEPYAMRVLIDVLPDQKLDVAVVPADTQVAAEPVDTIPVVVVEEPTGPILIRGVVYEVQQEPNVPLRPLEADITWYSQPANQEMGTIRTAANGEYEIRLPRGIYSMRVSEPYHFEVNQVVDGLKGEEVQQNVFMDPIPMEEGQTFVLKNIYFDLDKSTLKKESYPELNQLYELLKANPDMEIEVRGHTDSQASDDYNQRLSEARAASVVNFLKYKGVMGYRLQSRGFGEKLPVDTNDTEEGRANNRRVEFLILKRQ